MEKFSSAKLALGTSSPFNIDKLNRPPPQNQSTPSQTHIIKSQLQMVENSISSSPSPLAREQKKADEIPKEHLDDITDKLSATWKTFHNECLEIGLNDEEKTQKQSLLINSIINNFNENVVQIQREKQKLKNDCILKQKQIFQILRIFSKNGYKPSLRKNSADDEYPEISDETYTEINQIFSNEDEFNDIMKAIPDNYTKAYLTQKIVSPYQKSLDYLTLVAKLLAKEYFSRLLKFLRTVMLLKEYADEIDFFSKDRPDVDSVSINFSLSLPTIDQCKICVRELEKVNGSESNIDVIYKVVSEILKSNNFNNLSKTYLNKIQYQVELVEIEKEKSFELVIELSNSIVDLWKTLDEEYSDDEVKDKFDYKIVKCSEGDTSEISLKMDSIKYLKETHQNLLEKKTKRTNLINDYLIKCQKLFEKLKEEPEIINAFLMKYDNDCLTNEKVQSLENEYEKLIEKKKYYMKEIIDFVKLDIEKIWQKLYFSETNKNNVPYYYSMDYSDEALESLEETLKDLSNINDQFTNMHDKIGQFNVLYLDKQELDAASRNPDRLVARNSGTILLQEERKRKTLKKRFPKVCSELERMLKNYAEITKDYEKSEEFYNLIQKVKQESELLINSGKRSTGFKRSISPKRSPSKQSSPTMKSSPVKTILKNDGNPKGKLSPLKSNVINKISPKKMLNKTFPIKNNARFSPKKAVITDILSENVFPNRNNIKYSLKNKPVMIPSIRSLASSKNSSPMRLTNIPSLGNKDSDNDLNSPKRVPSIKYNTPLQSLSSTIQSKKRRSSELDQEPDNIFLMDQEQDKENIRPNNVKVQNAMLEEAEEFGGPIDYKEIESARVKKRPNFNVNNSSIFDLSGGDDSGYKDWRNKRLESLKSGLSNNILPDDL